MIKQLLNSVFVSYEELRDLRGCYPPNSLTVKYFNSSSAIKISQKQTRLFRYTRGVRQGCILSPLLFNHYISDLPSAFENTLSDPFVLPNGAKLRGCPRKNR